MTKLIRSQVKQYTMSSVQQHTIKGRPYDYKHEYVNGKVVCTYIGAGGSSTGARTHISSAPNQTRYKSQDELDAYIRKSYTRGGIGIEKIRTIFKDELGLEPSRRETENYVQSLGITLRKRAPKTTPTEDPNKTAAKDLARERDKSAVLQIELDSKNVQIKEMKASKKQDTDEILRLKESLMTIRDLGRVPTDAEIEKMIR